LIDTYNTIESGVKNFMLVALALNDCGYISRGVRLDSGDLAGLSIQCHEEFEKVAEKFNRPWLKDCDVVASNDINENTLNELNDKGHGITSFGIGTNLVTCQAQPALGCVFKLVELNGKPRIKLSNEIIKVLIPGQKRAFRLFNKDGAPQLDLMIRKDEAPPKSGHEVKYCDPFKKNSTMTVNPSRVEEILQTVWNGSDAAEVPNLNEARETCIKGIKSLDSGLVRRDNPSCYEVCVSEMLQGDLHRLWESHRGQK